MSEAQEPAAPAESAPPAGGGGGLADRLRETRIELRRDLDVSRHTFRGEVSYVLTDPLTFSSHRFSIGDYEILCMLRESKTLGETFVEVVDAELVDAEDEEAFYHFIFQLHRLGFLKLPISDEKTLYSRFTQRLAAERAKWLSSLFFYQLPLVNPDDLLGRTMRYFRWAFTKTAFAAWLLLIGTAVVIVCRSWTEFQTPAADIFSSGNLLALWTTLIALKIAHEFGHAYACKFFGGNVPEMGAYIIVMTPCAYMDASTSWRFSRKRDRIIVCFAGMYVELAIAAVAMIVWSVTPPGAVRSLAHNVVMLASIVTVGFNVNPLMRYDGYYALSDWIEVPNLRARSSAYATAVLKRIALGVRIVGEHGTSGLRKFLLGFGVASAIYKFTLVLGISAMIATKYYAIGLALAGTYVLMEIVRIVTTAVPYLLKSEEAAGARMRAVLSGLLIAVFIPLGVLGVPLPHHVITSGVIRDQEERILRAESSGFLDSVTVRPGSAVVATQPLIALVDEEVDAHVAEQSARLDVAEQRFSAVMHEPHAAAREAERVRQAREELEYSKEQLGRLRISSPGPGRVISCLPAQDVGRYVERGEPVARIGYGGTVVRALLTEEELESVRPTVGQSIEFRPRSRPDELLVGEVARIVPAGTRRLDEAFMENLDLAELSVQPETGETSRSQFEVEIQLDEAPEDLVGSTGHLRFEGRPAPLALIFFRKLLVFAGRLKG